MTFKEITIKAAKWSGICLLFLFVLEISARVDDWIRWDAPLLSNYSDENLRVSDSLGFHNRPNARFEKWKINSYGFRGPEITMDKPDGVKRVIVLGASETFGLFENEGMDYPSQMNSLLDSMRPGLFEVINAGCAGMSPPQIGHFYNRWIKKFNPDIIVYYPSPGFYLDLESPSTEFKPAGLANWKPSKRPRLFSKVKIVLKQFIPIQIQSYYKNYKRDKYISSHDDGWVFETAPPERLKDYRNQVSSFVVQVKNDSVEIILGTHANRLSNPLTDTDKYHLANWAADWPRATEACFIQMEIEGNKIINDLSDSLGIVVVDVKSKIPGSDEYFFDIGHFRNEGAAIIAREFVNAILKLDDGKKIEGN